MTSNSKGYGFSLAIESGDTYDTPNSTGTPERNLLMAILERAILDFVGNDSTEAEEAESWLFDDQTNTRHAFSFAWVCDQLDLNPSKISAAIKAMPKRGNYRVAPWYFQKREQLCA